MRQLNLLAVARVVVVQDRRHFCAADIFALPLVGSVRARKLRACGRSPFTALRLIMVLLGMLLRWCTH